MEAIDMLKRKIWDGKFVNLCLYEWNVLKKYRYTLLDKGEKKSITLATLTCSIYNTSNIKPMKLFSRKKEFFLSTETRRSFYQSNLHCWSMTKLIIILEISCLCINKYIQRLHFTSSSVSLFPYHLRKRKDGCFQTHGFSSPASGVATHDCSWRSWWLGSCSFSFLWYASLFLYLISIHR